MRVGSGWVLLSDPRPPHWALLLPHKVHGDCRGKRVLRGENAAADNCSGVNRVSSGSHGFSEMKLNACFIGTFLKLQNLVRLFEYMLGISLGLCVLCKCSSE